MGTSGFSWLFDSEIWADNFATVLSPAPVHSPSGLSKAGRWGTLHPGPALPEPWGDPVTFRRSPRAQRAPRLWTAAAWGSGPRRAQAHAILTRAGFRALRSVPLTQVSGLMPGKHLRSGALQGCTADFAVTLQSPSPVWTTSRRQAEQPPPHALSVSWGHMGRPSGRPSGRPRGGSADPRHPRSEPSEETASLGDLS